MTKKQRLKKGMRSRLTILWLKWKESAKKSEIVLNSAKNTTMLTQRAID